MITVGLLIAWNYWVPLAVVNPFSTRNLPFSQYGNDSADFHQYYRAGMSWLSGGNAYYDLRLIDGGFVYPPTSLPFFGMFARLDFVIASQLWAGLYFGVFTVALLALAISLKGDRRYVYISIAILLSLTSYPLIILFQLGQIDLLLSSLTILSLVAQRMKREAASAILLSIATLLKGPPALLLIYFVLYRRNLKYLARFALSTLVIVGVSLLVVPVRVYSYWIVNVFPTLSSAYALESNQSIPGVVANAHMSQITPAITIIGYSLFAIFTFWVSSKRSNEGNRILRADAMFLMNVLIMLLFGSRSTVYPYVWVILPLALFISTLLVQEAKTKYFIPVCAGAFLLNSVLSPDFLNYRTLPLALLGNLTSTLILIQICMRPTAVMKPATALV
jgi:hypothetical protein